MTQYLREHPWDAFGKPPDPGRPYDNEAEEAWACEAHSGSEKHTKREDCITALLEEADEHHEEASRYRDDMWEAESAEEECRRLARDLQGPVVRKPSGQMEAL